jgi:hypothetical protein
MKFKMKYSLLILLLISLHGSGQQRLDRLPMLVTPIDSFYAPPPKTVTVKGWVHYYSIDTLDRYWPWRIVDIDDAPDGRHIALVEHGRMAIAIYELIDHEDTPIVTLLSRNKGDKIKKPKPIKRLLKIMVDGKEFDLSKRHEFIPDNEIVK